MKQRVIIVGSDAIESLESSYARAFRRLGWSVCFWNPPQVLQKVARGSRLGQLLNRFVHIEPWIRKSNLDLLQVVEEFAPDLFLVIATSGVRAGTLAQIQVRMPAMPMYCIYPDSPHNLDADRIHCLPFFHRVTTSSPAWVKAFKQLGAETVEYLPFAADTELFQLGSGSQNNSRLTHDLTFIGTWRVEREQFLEQLSDFDLCIWGSNYWNLRTRKNSPLKGRWGGQALVGSEFVQACRSSKVSLNVMDPITWPGPNMRTFELPACGAFALVERTPAVLELFREGETIECFESVEEARSKIEFYLHNESSRQRISQASYRFVTESGHTYIDRVQQLCQWVAVEQIKQN